jgi:hypothetical protein
VFRGLIEGIKIALLALVPADSEPMADKTLARVA